MNGYSQGPRRRWCLSLLLFLLQLSSILGQDLITDRPDQTESAYSVPRGTFQMEVGWTRTAQPGPGSIDSLPRVLMRIGLLERLEVRVGFQGFVFKEFGGAGRPIQSRHGASDSSLGAKLELVSGSGLRPQVAFLGTVSLPTGETGFSSGDPDPSFRLSVSHQLSERISLGYNAGASWVSNPSQPSADRTGSVDWTLVLGAGAAARLGVFLELFGSHGEDLNATSLDGGLTYLVTSRFQLDTSLGLGITDDAPDWSVGAGISFRLPR